MRRADEAGFTLVEVLVAMVVSALLLVLIFQAAATASERLRHVADRREAGIDGRYLMARLHAGDPLPLAGRIGRFGWTLDRMVIGTDLRGLVELVRFDVRLRDARGHLFFTGATIRLQAAR